MTLLTGLSRGIREIITKTCQICSEHPPEATYPRTEAHFLMCDCYKGATVGRAVSGQKTSVHGPLLATVRRSNKLLFAFPSDDYTI